MARGEVKEAVGQGSSPMREALCLRLKDGAVWEVVLAARCLEWRARFSLDFPPQFEEQNFPFWECGIAAQMIVARRILAASAATSMAVHLRGKVRQ